MPTVTPQRRNSLYAVPPELIQQIVQYLTQSELFTICTLTRAFTKEVARALYCGHVNLTRTTFDQYLSFTSQIARQPELAQLIRVLSLPERLNLALSEDHEQLRHRLTRLLPSALKLMINLTSLFIASHRYIRGTIPTLYLHGDLFVGCIFRLKSFRMAGIYIPTETILPFLLEQSQIRNLEIGYMYCSGPDPDFSAENLLLNLSVVSTCYDVEAPFISNVIASRRLTRLKLRMNINSAQGDIENVMQAFVHAPASTTLTHLDFHFDRTHEPLEEAEHVEVLDGISRALPKLQFLRYSDLVASPRDWESLPRAVSAFKHLTMLALDVEDDENLRRRPRSDAHILAGRCMVSCPTLRCVAITGVEPSWATRMVQQHISFTRDPESSSGISVSGFQALEGSAWRDM